MSARPVRLNLREQALLTSIMWLEYEYDDQVLCLDVDFDSGRVTLFGDPSLTRAFNEELEAMVMSVADPMDAWRNV